MTMVGKNPGYLPVSGTHEEVKIGKGHLYQGQASARHPLGYAENLVLPAKTEIQYIDFTVFYFWLSDFSEQISAFLDHGSD